MISFQEKVEACYVIAIATISDRAVLKHWNETYQDDELDQDGGPGELKPKGLKDLKGFKKWKLTDVLLSKIKPHHNMPEDERVDTYQQMKDSGGTEFPAIILVPKGKGFETLDGVHRYWAAKKLGDKTIKAYIPTTG